VFHAQRAQIRRAFDRQAAGKERHARGRRRRLSDWPAWLDFTSAAERGAVVVWAVRVAPGFRRLGISAHLMAYAEQTTIEAGRRIAELGVEKTNADARRSYERLGYVLIGELCTETEFDLRMEDASRSCSINPHLGYPSHSTSLAGSHDRRRRRASR
jgi:predicted GNAT family acetyltransferase